MSQPSFEMLTKDGEVILKRDNKFYYFPKDHCDLVVSLVREPLLTLTIHRSPHKVWRVKKSSTKVIECRLTACSWANEEIKRGTFVCAVEVDVKWLTLFMKMDKSFFDERLSFLTTSEK